MAEGMVLGPYVLLEELGSGGMGVVYAALDPDLDRKIALKLLRTDKIRDPEARQRDRARLLREAQAMARLDHANVVTVHDVGTIEGRVYIAMDYVDGETLGAWIARGPHDVAAFAEIMVPAARGLSAAHAAGLVHRDFKPENVLIDRDGGVHVLDFGLAIGADISASARHIIPAGDEGPRMTNPGQVMGTPAYMSPEQHRGRPVDARSDQFSWCVAAWEALYGERPFGGRNRSAIAFKVVRGDVNPPPADVEVAPHVHAAILRGLASEPHRRWPSMDALLDAITKDPAVRRRRVRWLGVGTLVLGAAVAVWGNAPTVTPEPTCRRPADDVAGVYGQRERTALSSRIDPDGAGHAALGMLDRWSRSWSEVRHDACEATFVREEQSRELFALQERCLAARRRELADVLELSQTGDFSPGVAGSLLAGLGAPHDCHDRGALLDERARHRDATVDPAALGELDRRLDRAAALARAGELDRAQLLARETLDESERIGSVTTVAAASWVVGDVARRGGEIEQARLAFDRAAQLALGRADLELAARAWTGLVWLGVDQPELVDTSLEFGHYAASALESHEREGRSAARSRGALLLAMGSLLEARADLAAAEHHFTAAIDAFAQAPIPAELAMAQAYARRGEVRGRRGNLAAGAADLDESLRRLHAWQIPATAAPTTQARLWRADLALASGQLDEAEADYERVREASEARADGTQLRAAALTGLGEVALARGDLETAEAQLRLGLSAWTKAAPALGGLARARFSLAETLAQRDPGSEEARSEARRARELWRQGTPLEQRAVAQVDRWLMLRDEAQLTDAAELDETGTTP